MLGARVAPARNGLWVKLRLKKMIIADALFAIVTYLKKVPQNLNIPWAIGLFILNICDDWLAALYVRRVAQGDAFWATILSGSLTLLVFISVKAAIKNWRYLAPIVIGSMLGCYLAIRFD